MCSLVRRLRNRRGAYIKYVSTGSRKATKPGGTADVLSYGKWRPHQDSNLDLSLRRAVFYPLNYGDITAANGTKPTNKFPNFPKANSCTNIPASLYTKPLRYSHPLAKLLP